MTHKKTPDGLTICCTDPLCLSCNGPDWIPIEETLPGGRLDGIWEDSGFELKPTSIGKWKCAHNDRLRDDTRPCQICHKDLM